MKCFYGLLVIPELPVANHPGSPCLVFSVEGEEAWEVLPISLVSGLSLLANNTALLYGGVAFVSMVHANVTWRSKFEKGGGLERGNREKHRKPCWFQQEILFYICLFEDLLSFPDIYFACLFSVFSFCCVLFSFIFAWVIFTGKVNPLSLGHCLGSKHISQPPPNQHEGLRCWFQLLGEKDQRCIHSQWDSAAALRLWFYLVSPDNCIMHAISEADPGNAVCLNQPITISATVLILRPCHVCETQDVTTADPALRVPFAPRTKVFLLCWLHPPKTRKSDEIITTKL